MSERKRATKGQYRKTIEYKNKEKSRSDNELQMYLSIIDDLNGKLFNPAKYPDISSHDKELISCFDEDFADFEKSELWGIANSPDWRKQLDDGVLESLKGRIVSSYNNWFLWAQYGNYSDKYLELVASLHPATINSLPKIVPEFQSPNQIILNQELEQAYDPDTYSELRIDNFEQFKELEPSRYQKLATDRRDYHLQMAELIQTHTPIIKVEVDKWPREWMKQNKAIMKNLTTKRPLISILNYIRKSNFL